MYVDYLIRHWREIMWGSILSFFSMFYLFSCHGHPKIVETDFNVVLLPAPFGPIKPVILPFSTSIVALSTALIPPKFTDN